MVEMERKLKRSAMVFFGIFPATGGDFRWRSRNFELHYAQIGWDFGKTESGNGTRGSRPFRKGMVCNFSTTERWWSGGGKAEVRWREVKIRKRERE